MKSLLLLLFLATFGMAADFDRFDFRGEYYGWGTIENALEVTGPLGTHFCSIAISDSRQKFKWNLTESVYYMWPNASYITFAGEPGVCYQVENFTYNSEMTHWQTLRHKYDFNEGLINRERHVYDGTVIGDVGTCCDALSVAVVVDKFNRIRKLSFSQLYPPFSVFDPTHQTKNMLANGIIEYDFFRPVFDFDFQLPPECETPQYQFCEMKYQPYGFCNSASNTAVPLRAN